MVVCRPHVDLQGRQRRAGHGCLGAPDERFGAGEQRGRHETEEGDVDQVRRQDGGEGVVEICSWLVGVAEEAVYQWIGPVGEI